MPVTMLLAFLISAQPSGAKTMTPEWIAAVVRDWTDQDATYALTKMEQGDPEVIAQRYLELSQHLYNEQKDVAKMILASRAGIDYCLRKAHDLETENEKLALVLRGKAKAMSYNLGANCWPGWKDPGITIGATEREIGLDAAKLNLRMGVELKRAAEPLGHAHWLLGAHWLAAGKHEQASAEFRTCAAKYQEAGKSTELQMAVAYERLAERLREPKVAEHQQSLQDALAALDAIDTDDARFFAAQIRTAEEFFLTP